VEEPGKILALSTTGIGNLILYTPVLRTLREWFGDSRIILVCGSEAAAEVVSGSDLVDEIMVLDKSSALSYLNLLWSVRKRGIDMVVTSYLDRSFKVGLFALLSGARIRLGYGSGMGGIFYNFKAVPVKKHEVELNLDLLRAYSDGPLSEETEFFLTPQARLEQPGQAGGEKRAVGLHPGSGTAIGRKDLKRWPADKFARLAGTILEENDVKVLIFGGPGEESLGRRISRKAGEGVEDFTGKLSLKETAALIGGCSVFVSNDSGLMHVAASMKVPVVALFGPTLIWKNHPWKTDYKVITSGAECSPCYDLNGIECRNAVCMKDIKVEDVYSAVEGFLREER